MCQALGFSVNETDTASAPLGAKAWRQEIMRCIWDDWVKHSFCWHVEQEAVRGPTMESVECQGKALGLCPVSDREPS